MALCPHCKSSMTRVIGEPVTVESPAGNFNGIAYSCPDCSILLDVGIDPIAIKTDLVEEVIEGVIERWKTP
jgi:hypothetical protein